MVICEFEDGGKGKLRHVTVKALTLNDKNEILLVKRAPQLLRGGKYDVPGGYMDRDEDTKQAAIRELKEEAGIDGEIIYLFRINDNPNRPHEDRQNVDVIYIVKAKSNDVKTDHESTEIGWFSKENLPSEEEFAFDHRDSILKYFEYLEKPFELPIIG